MQGVRRLGVSVSGVRGCRRSAPQRKLAPTEIANLVPGLPLKRDRGTMGGFRINSGRIQNSACDNRLRRSFGLLHARPEPTRDRNRKSIGSLGLSRGSFEVECREPMKSAESVPNCGSASPRHFATEVILQDGCGPSTGFTTHTPAVLPRIRLQVEPSPALPP